MRVRRSTAAAVFAVSLASSVSGSAGAQDFDPAGRRHAKPPAASPPAPSHSGGPPPARPASPAKGATETAPSGPSTDALIARYTAVLLSQPASPFPLQRLAQLYRERDGNLKGLEAEFERRAATASPEQYAAKTALAAIYLQDGRIEDAVATYEAVIAARPKDAAPRLALAELARARGDLDGAKRRFEEALPLVGTQDREQTLRSLMTVSLDLKDFDSAKKYHRELVRQGTTAFSTRGELGRELEARGENARAEAEFREVALAASGDNRTLAPALRDLGRVLAHEHKNEEALAMLKKALVLAGAEAGVRREIFSLISDVYRSDNNLSELIGLLEGEKSNDFSRIVSLGALYEETGQVDKALGAYRRALSVSPRNIDVRLKVIHLLQAQGELEAAIREYEGLIRAAPHNPDYVFELCDALIGHGDRPRAIAMLRGLEQRAGSDEDMLARLADFYERIDEHDKSIEVLTRLSNVAPGDPSHLVDLGDRFYQQGDKKKALSIWARIKSTVPNRAKALATLGEVYLDHDMSTEGVDALREASQLEPQNVNYKKAYAVALERTAATAGSSATTTSHFEEARAIWEDLLAKSKGDKNLAREARTHIVTLYGLSHQLDQQVGPLTRKFAARPPDLEAGRLLAEVQTRLHKLSDAEATLRRLTELAPGDADVFLTLERVLVLEQNLEQAIGVLKKLAEIDPKRAREFYQRMAQYAAELYRDDDAVAYAARAVQLSPDDADGHRKLGEMYRKKQDYDRAIIELRAAIAKNDKLYPVYFELAELLLSRGNADEADQLFRRVLRAAPDEEFVSQAARQSMQINLGKGTLETLELDLLPVAIGNPRKPIYRRLLVELYGAMAFPLIQTVRHGQPKDAVEARKALSAMGARAIKPLLDALADEKQAQQRIAVDLLAFVQNKAAGPALFAFATSQAEQSMRVEAMVACGSLGEAALLPKFESLLLPKDEGAMTPGDPIALAAAWSVARLSDKRAAPLLLKLVSRSGPDLRALAAVGLGLLHEKRSAPALVTLARSVDAGNVARAAAAYALGEMGARESAPTLLALAQNGDSLPRQAAVLALARLKDDAAAGAIADGLLAPEPAVREGAESAALVLETGEYRTPRDPLPVPEGALDVRSILQALAPSGYSAAERAATLAKLNDSLEQALRRSPLSPDRARALADALLARSGKPAFGHFTDGIETVSPELRSKAERAAENIARVVIPAFVSLAGFRGSDVRERALQFLATRKEDEAQKAVADAISDDAHEDVQRLALSAVLPNANQDVVAAVSGLLRSKSWALRVRAAEALGRIGPPARQAGFDALVDATRSDPFALVREAGMRALARVDKAGAAPVLRERSEKDAETRLRALAKELLVHDPS